MLGIIRWFKKIIRVLHVASKPKKKDFVKAVKITALAVALIGLIGFLIFIIFKIPFLLG